MHYDITQPARSDDRHGSRAIAAIAHRQQDGPYWGDYDPEERSLHPAVMTTEQMKSFGRAMLVAGALLITFLLAGCSTYEHRDGGGYTVRYAAASSLVESPPPPPRPRKVVVHKSAPPPAPTVVLVEPSPRDRGESHPVLNVGKDDEIPREYRHYVSDRSVRTLRSRMSMCREQRPGYCNAPNVPHCHGPFCHAHQGGDKRHTH
jgi:hypothetical protein